MPEPAKVPDRECAFCGKAEFYGLNMAYPMPWLTDTDGRKWCGCEKGDEAGVRARLTQRLRDQEAKWAAGHSVYKANRPCPKCGNPTRTSKYHSGYGIWRGYGAGAFAWPYMERYCGRCEFTDYEVPLDYVGESRS